MRTAPSMTLPPLDIVSEFQSICLDVPGPATKLRFRNELLEDKK